MALKRNVPVDGEEARGDANPFSKMSWSKLFSMVASAKQHEDEDTCHNGLAIGAVRSSAKQRKITTSTISTASAGDFTLGGVVGIASVPIGSQFRETSKTKTLLQACQGIRNVLKRTRDSGSRSRDIYSLSSQYKCRTTAQRCYGHYED